MLTSKDYRQRAWNALNGKWGTVAITYLLVSLVSGIFSFFGGVLMFLFSGPIQYGLSTQALNVVRGNRVDVGDIMAAQRRLPDTILAYIINSFLTFLWSLLFIVPGIIAAYSYSMTYFIMVDNPNLTPDEARRQSIKLMDGNKLKLFYLHLSFIGWMLLCVLTLGLFTFWLMPYMECATAEFYESIIPPRVTVEHIERTIDPFDFDDNENAHTTNTYTHNNRTNDKTETPFYVFEEELPRDYDDNPDSNISGK